MLSVFAALCLLLVSGVQGTIITFEDGDHGVTAVDNMVVTNQYNGLTFGTLVMGSTDYANPTGTAFLEATGPGTGINTGPEGAWTGSGTPTTIGFNYNPDPFVSNSQISDTVAPGAGLDGLTQQERLDYLGEYFLRTSSFSRDTLIVMNSSEAMMNMTFEIWDMDGNPTKSGGEGWTVEAFYGDWTNSVFLAETAYVPGGANGGGILDTQSYDGQRCLFIINNNIVFDRFVIRFETTQGPLKDNDTVGLAFNNFQFTPIVPEPATLALLSLGGLLLRKRK